MSWTKFYSLVSDAQVGCRRVGGDGAGEGRQHNSLYYKQHMGSFRDAHLVTLVKGTFSIIISYLKKQNRKGQAFDSSMGSTQGSPGTASHSSSLLKCTLEAADSGSGIWVPATCMAFGEWTYKWRMSLFLPSPLLHPSLPPSLSFKWNENEFLKT